MIAHTHSRF